MGLGPVWPSDQSIVDKSLTNSWAKLGETDVWGDYYSLQSNKIPLTHTHTPTLSSTGRGEGLNSFRTLGFLTWEEIIPLHILIIKLHLFIYCYLQREDRMCLRTHQNLVSLVQLFRTANLSIFPRQCFITEPTDITKLRNHCLFHLSDYSAKKKKFQLF